MSLLKPDIDKLRASRDVSGLVKALHHRDPLIRWQAAEALGDLGDANAVEPLAAAAIAEMGQEAAWPVAEALGKLDDPRAVEPLIGLLGSASGETRIRAIEGLDKLGDERAVEPLIALLGDSAEGRTTNRIVRPTAANAIRRFGSAAVDPLIASLADQSSGFQDGVAGLLGELHDARAVEPLIGALEVEDVYTRGIVAEALG